MREIPLVGEGIPSIFNSYVQAVQLGYVDSFQIPEVSKLNCGWNLHISNLDLKRLTTVQSAIVIRQVKSDVHSTTLVVINKYTFSHKLIILSVKIEKPNEFLRSSGFVAV